MCDGPDAGAFPGCHAADRGASPGGPRARSARCDGTVVDMLTTSQLTPAQRRIRESTARESADIGRIAHHRIELARVRESVARIPDRRRRRD